MTRVGASVERLASVGAAAVKPRSVCLVCQEPAVRSSVVVRRRTGRQMTAMVCRSCGYVHLPENTHDYTTSTSTKSLGLAPRCGTKRRRGREFGMAELGVEAVGRAGLAVLVYGVGRSEDNLHIAKLDNVKRVAIGDIMKIRDDGEFVDLTQPAAERFDVVVAAEVVEHFLDPHSDFDKLLDFVADDGILVCSTNINDGLPLGRVPYIFKRGHVSYYSPESLRTIARAHGVGLDFRFPLAATGGAGPRKRYVIFSRTPAVMDAVSDYFGRHPYAPSEPLEAYKSHRAKAKPKAHPSLGSRPRGLLAKLIRR